MVVLMVVWMAFNISSERLECERLGIFVAVRA